MLSVSDAHGKLIDRLQPLDPESVPLGQATGRVLRETVTARRSQPPSPLSAMDGYAVRAADLETPPAVLTVVATQAAGRQDAGRVAPGTAVRIFTGAVVPPGADMVVAQEDCDALSESGAVSIGIEGQVGRHVRPAGLDFHTGDRLIEPPRILSAAHIALAAAGGWDRLSVSPRPTVAVIATGDELIQPADVGTDRDGPHRQVASSLYGLMGALQLWGAEPMDLGITVDDRTALRRTFEEAETADLIVTLGGASVGDHDLVQDVLQSSGGAIDFWRIAMRPGKPLMVGQTRSGRPFIGLPGNPVSALVCAELFVRAAVDRLRGLDGRLRGLHPALAGQDLPPNGVREDYMRASLKRGPTGDVVATPFEIQDSSMLTAYAQAEALLVRPPQARALKAGDPCTILPLRNLTNL